MATRFPARLPDTGETHAAKDLDDGLRPFVEEVNASRLNEHNIDAGLAFGLGDLAEDYAFRSNCTQVWKDLGQEEPPDDVSTLVWTDLPADGTWQAVPGMRVMAVSEDGGTYRLLCNVQAYNTTNGFVQVGIRVDGTVYPDLVSGDQDSGYSDVTMELGYGGLLSAPSVEGILPLAPGVHTFDVVLRAVVRRPASSGVGVGKHMFVAARQFFVIEQGR